MFPPTPVLTGLVDNKAYFDGRKYLPMVKEEKETTVVGDDGYLLATKSPVPETDAYLGATDSKGYLLCSRPVEKEQAIIESTC